MPNHKNEKGPGGNRSPLESSQQQRNHTSILASKSTATEAQLQKLILLLQTRPRHTHELRMAGISHPAGRVRDLLGLGYVLQSDRVVSVDSDGFAHKGVALYSLVREPGAAS